MAGLPNIYDSCQKSKEINQNATINNNSNTNSKSSNSTSNLQQRQQLGNCNCSNTRHRQKRQSDVCLRRLVAACLPAWLPRCLPDSETDSPSSLSGQQNASNTFGREKCVAIAGNAVAAVVVAADVAASWPGQVFAKCFGHMRQLQLQGRNGFCTLTPQPKHRLMGCI